MRAVHIKIALKKKQSFLLKKTIIKIKKTKGYNMYAILTKIVGEDYVFRFISTMETMVFSPDEPLNVRIGDIFYFIVKNNKIIEMEYVQNIIKKEAFLLEIKKIHVNYHKALFQTNNSESKEIISCCINNTLRTKYADHARKKGRFVFYYINNEYYIDLI